MEATDYRIAIICALPTELACVEGMLDQHHPNIDKPLEDNNTYVYGQIGHHNVVLACLAAGIPGIASAAVAAAQVWRTFRQLRFGLMVGVGGGVPGIESSQHNDVRLGDIVVSKPIDGFGGVVQYDFGKTVPRDPGSAMQEETGHETEFIRTGALNAPPIELLNVVARLEARHRLVGSDVSKFVSKMSQDYPRMRDTCTYPGWERDQLFKAAYQHQGGRTCQSCDPTQLVHREARQEPHNPVIHYGNIASANQVMRHGVTRDRIAAMYDTICFEMEAAGLMNGFPCLIIRGVCDYADSHKNKIWQPYAAAVAAAYAKELLGFISGATAAPIRSAPEDTTSNTTGVSGKRNREQQGTEMIEEVPRELHGQRIREDEFVPFPFAQNASQLFEVLSRPQGYLKRRRVGLDNPSSVFIPAYVRSFCHYDYAREFSQKDAVRLTGTCQWLLEHTPLRTWADSKSSELLWFSGSNGIGKTTSATFIVRYLQGQTGNFRLSQSEALAYSFINSIENNTTSASFSIIIHQLLSMDPRLAEFAFHTDEMVRAEGFQFRLSKGRYRSSHTLWNLLYSIITYAKFSKLFLVLDGLDQFDADSQREILNLLGLSKSHIRIVLTSRPTETILGGLSNMSSFQGKRFWRLHFDDYKSTTWSDINHFIHQETNRLAEAGVLSERQKQHAHLYLSNLNTGTFLPVALVLRKLSRLKSEDVDAILNAAQDTIPSIFSRIRDSLSASQTRLARKLLQYVINSFRPLTLSELAFVCSPRRAVFTNRNRAEQLVRKKAIEELRVILDLMTPLLDVRAGDNTVHIHHVSARDFFEAEAERPGQEDALLMPRDKAQHAIATECLDLIIAAFPIPFPPSWRDNLVTLRAAVHAQIPLLSYVTQHWIKHLQIAAQYEPLSRDIRQRVELLDSAWHLMKNVAFTEYLAQELESVTSLNRRPSLLDIVTRHGITEIAQLLIGFQQQRLFVQQETEAGANLPSSPDNSFHSAVLNAISSSTSATLDLLIQKYHIVSLNDKAFSDCLTLAVSSRNIHILRSVLKLRDRRLKELADALGRAVLEDFREAVHILLEDDFLITARDRAGRSIMHLIFSPWRNLGKEDILWLATIIGYFIDKGLSINMQDNWGNTPLVWSFFFEYKPENGKNSPTLEFVYALLKLKADPLKSSNTGVLPLHVAAYRAHDPQIVAMLILAGGAGQLARTTRGRLTPLHWAACRGESEQTTAILDILLRQGADPTAVTALGISPVERSRQLGGALASFQIVNTLLDGIHYPQLAYPSFPEMDTWDPETYLDELLAVEADISSTSLEEDPTMEGVTS